MTQRAYVAVVQQVKKGHHGWYGIATANGISGSITFSLDAPVWEEEERPEAGTHVVLSGLIHKRAGWRARKARYMTPDDNQ